ncbi:glycosyltransferase family 2 protein [Alloscardovia criceti]|uniref:glycosyltransferase family 2 protein n=1 Tax=Alloscardovia criceti TaxID=356828 RepID=UPI00037FBD13|nr:glycosyltransferase family 2 protein [Alloscardovia criceti]
MNETSKPSVAVLLPCYNEEITIGKVVQDFQKSLPDATIYVYDNNSTDRTVEIAQSLGAVVRRESRQGKGNVIRAMFNEIDADVYVMADGDDTYPAEAAPRMVDKVLEGYDMVIGDRLSSTYFEENKRPFHNFGNSLVRDSINFLFQSDVKDIMTGYRAFSFSFAKSYPILSQGFEVETEMTIHSLDKNMRLYEMPIQYRDRPEGSESKLNTLGDGFKVMVTIFRMIREYKPLPFFTALGSLLGIIGLGLMIPIVIRFWETHVVLQFPTLFGCFFLILSGLMLIVTGIILDVLAKNERRQFIATVNSFDYLRRSHTK